MLRRCSTEFLGVPDKFPPKATNELLFVTIRSFARTSVKTSALSLSPYRTRNGRQQILAGAAMQALLHWKLGSGAPSDNDIQTAIVTAPASGPLKSKPDTKLDKWSLHHFEEVCGEVNVLRPKTVEAARLCNSYRNLIHPGRGQRLGEVCTRGTAYVAVGALSNVVDDLDIGTG